MKPSLGPIPRCGIPVKSSLKIGKYTTPTQEDGLKIINTSPLLTNNVRDPPKVPRNQPSSLPERRVEVIKIELHLKKEERDRYDAVRREVRRGVLDMVIEVVLDVAREGQIDVAREVVLDVVSEGQIDVVSVIAR